VHKIALIDADIISYRVGFACQDENDERYVARTVRSFITDILIELEDVEDYECFLTGKGNFRTQYAVTQEYKGNRKGNERPKWIDYIREVLETDYDASVSAGQEADDDIAIRATELGEDCVLCSVDKDFDQIKGHKYNFVKKERYYITEEEGLLNFYCQFLEGDTVDNIKGVRGIGKKTARKLLEGKSEEEMFNICTEKLESYDRALENGILLYLRRKPNEVWEAPVPRPDSVNLKEVE